MRREWDVEHGGGDDDEQPELPFQRHSETSKDAAYSKEPSAATERARVLEALRRRWPDGLTDDEQQQLLDMNPSTQRPRRIELCRGGLVEDSGEKRPTRTGRMAVMWRVTEKGKRPQ